MKIKKLIKELKKHNPNLEVFSADHLTDFGIPSNTINSVDFHNKINVLQDCSSSKDVINSLPDKYLILS